MGAFLSLSVVARTLAYLDGVAWEPALSGLDGGVYSDRRASTFACEGEGLEIDTIVSAYLQSRGLVDAESREFVKYVGSGQGQELHHDMGDLDDSTGEISIRRGSSESHRLFTLVVYLTTNVGGCTNFPRQRFSFAPRAGAAVFWQNGSSPRCPYHRAVHEGQPPLATETKIALLVHARWA
jgi:hypothetical protein